MNRLTTYRVAIGPTARSMAWTPLCASAVLSLSVVVGMTLTRRPELPQILMVVRLAGVLLSLGAPFVLDDPAAATVASAPLTLLERRGLRGGLAFAAVLPVWALILGYAAVRMDGGLPLAAFTLETSAWLAFSFVVAAASIARGHIGGPSGAVALLLAHWSLPLIPERWSPLAGAPGQPGWGSAHLRWGAVLVAALCVTIVLSLDPARAKMRARLRRA